MTPSDVKKCEDVVNRYLTAFKDKRFSDCDNLLSKKNKEFNQKHASGAHGGGSCDISQDIAYSQAMDHWDIVAVREVARKILENGTLKETLRVAYVEIAVYLNIPGVGSQQDTSQYSLVFEDGDWRVKFNGPTLYGEMVEMSREQDGTEVLNIKS